MNNKLSVVDKVRTCFKIALLEWQNVFYSTKILILAIMCIFLKVQIIDTIINAAVEMDGKVSIIEPFAAICNSPVVLLIVPILFFTMMSDFPKENAVSKFVGIRTNTLLWVIGEMLFVIVSSVTMVVFLFAASVIMTAKYVSFTFTYSDVVAKYMITFPDRENDYFMNLFRRQMYNQLELKDTVLYSCSLMLLLFILFGMIMLFASIINVKMAGIVLNCVILISGVFDSVIKWHFPLPHTILMYHFREYLSKPIMELKYSYLYFFERMIPLILLIIVFRKVYKRK